MALKYRVHTQVVLEKVAERYFLIAYGDATRELPYLCEINETGACFWRLMKDGLDTNAMIAAALDIFETTPEALKKGLHIFLQDLLEKNYILPDIS